MSETTCAVEDCPTTRLEARGWCAKHYVRWRRFDTVELQGRSKPKADPPPCAVEGCDRAGQRTPTGWCKTHQERWQRTGELGSALIPTRRSLGAQCLIEDCGAKAESRGWCGKHYMRFRAHGDPLTVVGRERTGIRSCFLCERTPDEVPFKLDKRAPDGLGAYCKECEKAYNAAHHSTNREARNADNNARYYANRERYLAHQHAQRAANISLYRERERNAYRRHRAHRLEYARRWREANRERARATQRRWYEANKARHRETCRLWAARNRDRVRELSANTQAWRSAQKRNADGRIESVNRRYIWKRDGGICGLCAQPVPFREMHLDHHVPLAKGGAHTASNVQPTHPYCNLSKGNREVPRWGFAAVVIPELVQPGQGELLDLSSFTSR